MKSYLFSYRSRLVALLAMVPGVLGSFGAAARAEVISTSACDGAVLTQPFARWGDANLYKLAPGGDFESSVTGWTLAGGARKVAGSEPYAVTGREGAYSLSLPAGASATTATTCVNAAYPTIRFFARNGGLISTLLVQVVYGGATIPVGLVTLSSTWQPTLPMITGSAITGALTGGTAQVALRFTAVTGNSQVDDIYIDPRMSR